MEIQIGDSGDGDNNTLRSSAEQVQFQAGKAGAGLNVIEGVRHRVVRSVDDFEVEIFVPGAL